MKKKLPPDIAKWETFAWSAVAGTIAIAIVIAFALLTGCNTVQGVGHDLIDLSQGTEDRMMA